VCYRSFLLILGAVIWLPGCSDKASTAVKVRVGHFPNVTHAQPLIGRQNGWFAQALGPDVVIDWKIFAAGPAALQAMFAGEIDLAYLGPGPAISGYVKSQGRALRIIAGACDGGAALIVRPEAGIHSPADFHGKKIASPQLGNTQDLALRGWLTDHGLTVAEKGGDVQVMPMANPDQLTMFRLGRIDGAWSPEPWASRLEHEGGGSVLFDEREIWKDVGAGDSRRPCWWRIPSFLRRTPISLPSGSRPTSR